MTALFSAFGLNWKLLLAQAVNFAILLVALSYFLYKPVMRILEERRRVVAKGVEDAAKAATELAHAGERAAGIVDNAETEAEGIVKSARMAAGEQSASAIAAAEARAAQIAKDAEARAAESSARMLRESEKEISRLAILAAGKVLAEKV